MRAMLLSCLLVLALSGCGSKEPATGTVQSVNKVEPTASTPQEKLYEQLRSGVFQISSTLTSLEDALKEAKATTATSADIKQSLADIHDAIDSAGEILGDEAAEEPKKDAVTADMVGAEKRRVKLCELANDALHDLRDARGIVDSLANDNETGPLEKVGIQIDVAMDDLRGALEALGGKEQVEE